MYKMMKIFVSGGLVKTFPLVKVGGVLLTGCCRYKTGSGALGSLLLFFFLLPLHRQFSVLVGERKGGSTVSALSLYFYWIGLGNGDWMEKEGEGPVKGKHLAFGSHGKWLWVMGRGLVGFCR
jgi:hypothetical protein